MQVRPAGGAACHRAADGRAEQQPQPVRAAAATAAAATGHRERAAVLLDLVAHVFVVLLVFSYCRFRFLLVPIVRRPPPWILDSRQRALAS